MRRAVIHGGGILSSNLSWHNTGTQSGELALSFDPSGAFQGIGQALAGFGVGVGQERVDRQAQHLPRQALGDGRDLGATPWQTVRHVVLPIIAPSLIGVALFGFTLSYPRDNPAGFAFEPWHWAMNG